MTAASRWTVGAGAALFGGCVIAGWWLSHHGYRLHLGSAYPLNGHYTLHLAVWLVPALVLAAALVHSAGRLADTLPWRRLLVAAYLGAVAWAVALALVGGPGSIAAPLTSPHEYLFEVARIDAMGVRTYLRTFTWYIVSTGHGPVWTTHVAGHPPLATLVFVLLARAGLAGPGWAAALCIGAGASAAPSVLATVRLAGGEPLARRAAPFVAAAPAALWIATSADALYTGVSAAGLCALAYAGAARRAAATAALGAAGGLALGACLFLSYGLTLLATLALAVVAVTASRLVDAARVVAAAALGVAAVVAAFALAGFWWLDGLHLTVRRVVEGGGWLDRPAAYFVFANVAALSAAVGPAVLAALPVAVRERRWWLAIPAAAALSVVVAIATGLSKGEVERIYLPFAVWLLPLAGLVGNRWWLGAQVGWALLVAATTRLDW